MPDRLLVLEDEALLGQELVRHYRRKGWQVSLATTLNEARRELGGEGVEPLVVLSDMSLPDGNALDLLEQLRHGRSDSEWILLTAYGSIRESVRALHLGAFDFLEKPCEFERLDLVVAGAARSARAQRRLSDQTAEGNLRFSVSAFVGQSATASAVREMLARLAGVPFSALLVTGETGTGKGLAARIVHHSGPRSDGPLIEVNCAAIPKELLESEVFGHEAGAFTGARTRHRGLLERADRGTLFLDEISEIGPDLQVKLLRAIEERAFSRLGADSEIHVDVQLIAATNRDIRERVRRGAFRADLYHRLNVFNLELPPLRERGNDIDDLVPLFVAEFNAKAGKNVTTIGDEVWHRLRSHAWPGNVRELRNVVERCVLFAEDETFPLRWLQLGQASPDAEAPTRGGAPPHVQLPLDGTLTLEQMDREIILAALKVTGFNVTAAARILKTSRETLRYRIQKHRITSKTS